MLQEQYYVIGRTRDENHPWLTWDQPEVGRKGQPVEVAEPLRFRVGEPRPDTLEWADYLRAPEALLSPRLGQVLAALDIHGVQLVPAQVRDPASPEAPPQPYLLLNVTNLLECIDRQSSVLDTSSNGDLIWSIERLVLREDVLERVAPEQRRVFQLAEDSNVILVHQSVRDALLAAGPSGIRFHAAYGWDACESYYS